jgi:hypothetical protein
VRAHGWISSISSTHSHLTRRTKASRSNWQKFIADKPAGAETAYLVAVKGMLPRVAAGAVIAEETAEFVFFEQMRSLTDAAHKSGSLCGSHPGHPHDRGHRSADGCGAVKVGELIRDNVLQSVRVGNRQLPTVASIEALLGKPIEELEGPLHRGAELGASTSGDLASHTRRAS